MNKLKVKKLHNDAILPQYATTGAAFDLHACETVVYGSGKSAVIDTGLAFEVPEGYALMIYSRGHGFNNGWRLANSVGVVDSDFRGSVKVKLVSDRACVTPSRCRTGRNRLRRASAEVVLVDGGRQSQS